MNRNLGFRFGFAAAFFGCVIWHHPLLRFCILSQLTPSSRTLGIRNGLGPSPAICSVMSVAAATKAVAMAADMLNILTRSGSRPICDSKSLICSIRRLAFVLPSR